VPKAVHRSGCRDKHNWPRPLTLQSIMPSINQCDLLRHVGVNNLPKVVTMSLSCIIFTRCCHLYHACDCPWHWTNKTVGTTGHHSSYVLQFGLEYLWVTKGHQK